KLIVERFNRVKEWIHELIIQYNDLASGEPSSSGGSSTAGNSSSSGNGEGQVDVRLPISWDPASKCLESGKSLSECLGIKLKQREPLLPGWRDLIDVIPTDPREIIRGPLTTITSQ
ncbi:MAG: hypothetical protein KDD25_05120, partial [Bdellovibrionales bacterium]|nr:hypothetical protein [Bdellovibrionales bacterium]